MAEPERVDDLPPPIPFVPVDTMFKLDGPDSTTVRCIACDHPYPLSDLTEGELEEDRCPACKTPSEVYWQGKARRSRLNGA